MDYKKHYNLLIENSRSRDILDGYKEKHHIVPKCMGGDDNSSNLVELTAREHYIVHWLLHKIYPNNLKCVFALNFMTYGTTGKHLILSSKDYEKIKKLNTKAMSKLHKGNILSEEHKQKISIANKNKTKPPRTKEHIENHSKSMKGKNLGVKRNFTKKWIENIRKSRICKSVCIDGKIYKSISEASRQLGLYLGTVQNRIKSPKFPNYKYI